MNDTLRPLTVPYSLDALVAQLAQASRNTPEAVRAKAAQIGALHRRLEDLGVRTIVVEHSYTDRDFLDDYAAYYVRCLDKYVSRCARLHFFRERFDDARLRRDCEDGGDGLEARRYAGFVVVKPLPETFIGRTCLPPPPTTSAACFVTRPYSVHLLGFDLSIDSLAFQEQDHATAACATSALWSVFHATGKLFEHPIVSPVEITRHATDAVGYGRSFPNAGLDVLQMATAVRKSGLDPEVVPIPNRTLLQAIVEAYVSARIPLALLCRMFELPARGRLRHYDEHDPTAGHAVAVSGFQRGPTRVRPFGPTGIRLRSSRITRLYAHDDQVGPYVPMDFVDVAARRVGRRLWPRRDVLLSSAWPGRHGRRVLFAAEALILPLYHKVRISFSTVFRQVRRLDLVLEQNRLGLVGTRPRLPTRLSWDIRLSKEHDLKARVRRSAHVDGAWRYEFLRRALPRFVWSATAYSGDEPLIELVYDATDVDQGTIRVTEIAHAPALVRRLGIA